MKKKNFFQNKIILSLVILCGWYSLAQGSQGSLSGYAWGENIGWIDFGRVEGGGKVSDDKLSGYAWGENIGWLSLDCANNNVCSTSDFGVKNDGAGNLSGYAWGENIGWVDFNPTSGGVIIDESGFFSGYAWSENAGWISFTCENTNSCDAGEYQVSTTWRVADEDEDDKEDINVHDVECSATAKEIVVKWETDQSADSYVRYGRDQNLKKQEKEERREKKHQLTLRNLLADSRYYFRVKSTDADGNYDTSRVYSCYTLSEGNSLASRSLNLNQPAETQTEDDYEEVPVKVEDYPSNKTPSEEDEPLEILPKNDQSANYPAPDGDNFVEKESVFSSINSRFFGWVASIQNGVKGNVISLQTFLLGNWEKGRLAFSDWKEKRTVSSDLAKQEKAKQRDYFTTEIFEKEGQKHLAQVKFQLLDNSGLPIVNQEATLFSEPKTTISDENGIATFGNVPIGKHTLAFNFQGEEVRKAVEIGETLTEQGMVRMEVVAIKIGQTGILWWVWVVIFLMLAFFSSSVFLGWKYLKLKKREMVV